MSNQTNQQSIVTPSYKGEFGWERIGSQESELAVPVIIRTNGVRYCPTRIVEQEIIRKFITLPRGVFDCINLKSYHLTATEAKLINEINMKHCNQHYGTELFRTDDVMVDVADIEKLARFLNVARQIQFKTRPANEVFHGVIKLVIDPKYPQAARIIPFLVKKRNNENLRYLPSALVAAFADVSSAINKGYMNEWDIMYCKMVLFFSGGPDRVKMTKNDLLIPLVGSIYIRSKTPLVFYECDQS